jgi:Resolvase, N terminal domain
MIAKAGAGFKSLTDKWADTTTPHGRLMLTVLGGLAEFERELILARTSDRRTRAKARGVRFRRLPALTPISVRKPSSDFAVIRRVCSVGSAVRRDGRSPRVHSSQQLRCLASWRSRGVRRGHPQGECLPPPQ